MPEGIHGKGFTGGMDIVCGLIAADAGVHINFVHIYVNMYVNIEYTTFIEWMINTLRTNFLMVSWKWSI